MQRERLLVGMLLVVLLAGVPVVILAPQATATTDDPVRQGYIEIDDIRITDGRVGGETVDLSTDVRLSHSGGLSKNVTVELRAVSLDTGLEEASRQISIGDLKRERQAQAVGNLTVDRGGNYRIEAIVYQNGKKVEGGRREVYGTGALPPEYAAVPVEFHQFTGQNLPAIEYSITASNESRATLTVSSYLTNTGDSTVSDLRIELKARQIESQVLAAEQTVTVDSIGPGKTTTPQTTLTVPTNYNYYLDAVLWKDGHIIGTTRASARLDPSKPIPENTTTQDVQFNTGDFASGSSEDTQPPRESTPTPTGGAGSPGFGILIAVVAVLATSLLIARGTHD